MHLLMTLHVIHPLRRHFALALRSTLPQHYGIKHTHGSICDVFSRKLKRTHQKVHTNNTATPTAHITHTRTQCTHTHTRTQNAKSDEHHIQLQVHNTLSIAF